MKSILRFDLPNIIRQIKTEGISIRRRFVAACGCTPIEYLTSLRIENAKKLLERRHEMELTVSEIAIRCGYYDSHYFSKAFKKRVGISPEHYTAKREEEI